LMSRFLFFDNVELVSQRAHISYSFRTFDHVPLRTCSKILTAPIHDRDREARVPQPSLRSGLGCNILGALRCP
jgi:hypothetical protein